MNRRQIIATLAALPIVGRAFAKPSTPILFREPISFGQTTNHGNWEQTSRHDIGRHHCSLHEPARLTCLAIEGDYDRLDPATHGPIGWLITKSPELDSIVFASMLDSKSVVRWNPNDYLLPHGEVTLSLPRMRYPKWSLTMQRMDGSYFVFRSNHV